MSVEREERDLARRYARRPPAESDQRYSPLNMAQLLADHQRERLMMHGLAKGGVRSLRDFRILDVGCGGGWELVRLIALGASPQNVVGIEILPDRVATARALHPSITVVQGSATSLPWPDCHFDLILQSTTFSSILDSSLRRIVAAEIFRVLKPGGWFIWYDFWLNPFNRDTRAIGRGEIRNLFPSLSGRLHRVTLAPPLSRRLAPLSVGLTALLQEIAVLNTHYLATLRKLRYADNASPT
jgi:SAM-dependent methyltransferase